MKSHGVRDERADRSTRPASYFADKSPNYAFKKRDGTDETLVKYYYDVSVADQACCENVEDECTSARV